MKAGPLLTAPSAVRAQHGPSRIESGAWRRRRGLVFSLVDLVVILGVWHVVVVGLELVNPVFFPAPLDVVKGFARLADTGLLWSNLRASAQNWAIGYGAGVALGAVAGLAIGSIPSAFRLVSPLLWAAWATPLIALQPIITVWFGFGALPIIILVWLSTVIPVALNTIAGVSGVDASLVRAARVFGAARSDIYRKVDLPWTLPYIISGMRLAVPTSLIGLLVGEMIGSPTGVGSIIVTSIARFRTNQAFAAIVIFVVVSVVLVRGIDAIERRVGAWRGDAA